MLTNVHVQHIHTIWDTYVTESRPTLDTKGNPIPDFENKRRRAIVDIRQIIHQFQQGALNLYEFKTSLDSYNKRNNYWGFTAIKGQMFFNQLVKNNEQKLEALTELLQQSITVPKELTDALDKVETLEQFAKRQYSAAKDKRKVANPSSTGYFLSYFWQVHDPDRWPIMYTSLIQSFRELGIWEDGNSQSEDYRTFFRLNEEIKQVLTAHTGRAVSNWDAEYAFWDYNGHPRGDKKQVQGPTATVGLPPVPAVGTEQEIVGIKANFNLEDYLFPRIASLVEVGSQTGTSPAAKGSQYEKMVAEIFQFLEFDVQVLGQGSGRNPDAILRFREENTAFIVDAKAYSNGYSLGIDDRAIKEYVHHYCPALQREGYKKVGFIIVSNSFKSSFDSFINDITWNTDIKRFILLSSEALLYLFAYKMKDRLSLNIIIEKLIGCGNVVSAADIVKEFEDV